MTEQVNAVYFFLNFIITTIYSSLSRYINTYYTFFILRPFCFVRRCFTTRSIAIRTTGWKTEEEILATKFKGMSRFIMLFR